MLCIATFPLTDKSPSTFALPFTRILDVSIFLVVILDDISNVSPSIVVIVELFARIESYAKFSKSKLPVIFKLLTVELPSTIKLPYVCISCLTSALP